jgi:hypothetical protein
VETLIGFIGTLSLHKNMVQGNIRFEYYSIIIIIIFSIILSLLFHHVISIKLLSYIYPAPRRPSYTIV